LLVFLVSLILISLVYYFVGKDFLFMTSLEQKAHTIIYCLVSIIYLRQGSQICDCNMGVFWVSWRLESWFGKVRLPFIEEITGKNYLLFPCNYLLSINNLTGLISSKSIAFRTKNINKKTSKFNNYNFNEISHLLYVIYYFN
jgi:hypothetical protein